VFPEIRENPIQWFDSIQERKITEAIYPKNFILNAQPGEFFVYQLGVWALKQDAADVKLKFTGLREKNGNLIPGNRITCFNKDGIDFKGRPFSKMINVAAGRIQALWIGIDLKGIKVGNYAGSVSVAVHGEIREIPIQLKIGGEPVPNMGYNDGARLSRINWLNSTVGINEDITKGYLPVKVKENKVSILGCTLDIAASGLPAYIASYFDASNQSLVKRGEPIVAHPFRFIIETENGSNIRLVPGRLNIMEQTAAKVVWKVINTSDVCDLECTGQMEFDGFVEYRLKLIAKSPLKVKDIRLEIPVFKEKAEYMMGLGQEGGLRTPGWKWKWDVKNNQDILWIGAVNGGLRIKWKAENYKRPLISIYYKFGPLQMPPSWENNGKGGVSIADKNNVVEIQAFSGKRELKKGAVLNYDFELLITPFKLIDKDIKFEDRYYHAGANTAVKIGNAKAAEANAIIIHHAEDIYPFINYPYLDANRKALTDLVANAHRANMRMKLYYTTRELTKNLPEFWALNSLNGEVIFPGPGNATLTEALHPQGSG